MTYRRFHKEEMKRIKLADPSLPQTKVFTQAALNWKTSPLNPKYQGDSAPVPSDAAAPASAAPVTDSPAAAAPVSSIPVAAASVPAAPAAASVPAASAAAASVPAAPISDAPVPAASVSAAAAGVGNVTSEQIPTKPTESRTPQPVVAAPAIPGNVASAEEQTVSKSAPTDTSNIGYSVPKEKESHVPRADEQNKTSPSSGVEEFGWVLLEKPTPDVPSGTVEPFPSFSNTPRNIGPGVGFSENRQTAPAAVGTNPAQPPAPANDPHPAQTGKIADDVRNRQNDRNENDGKASIEKMSSMVAHTVPGALTVAK
ncbi:hypothetical protein H4S06_001561 [Coemansia sp. BCRC 34490]|nr:hypothetical protein H4S06_001561 [Coemansia sp. BCRC 34490]